jgi:hypothetical protein
VRTCYQSAWRLYRDRPDILVRGRYYRAPPGTPAYPGAHHFLSRDWTAGENEIDGPFGEVVGYPRKWDSGLPPDLRPIPKIVGSADCIEHGETELPKPVLTLVESDAGGPIIVTGDFPALRVDWGRTVRPGVLLHVGLGDARELDHTALGVMLHVGPAALEAPALEALGLGVMLNVGPAAIERPGLEALGLGVMLHVGPAAIERPGLEALGLGVMLHVGPGAVEEGGTPPQELEGLGVMLHVGPAALEAPAREALGLGVMLHVGLGAVELPAREVEVLGVMLHVGLGAVELPAREVEGLGVMLHVGPGAVEEADPDPPHEYVFWENDYYDPGGGTWCDVSVYVDLAGAGTFTLIFDLDYGGTPDIQETPPVVWNATNGEIIAALEAIMDPADIDGVVGNGIISSPWVITIKRGNVAMVDADESGLS